MSLLSQNDHNAVVNFIRSGVPSAKVDDDLVNAVALALQMAGQGQVQIDWKRYEHPLNSLRTALGITQQQGADGPLLLAHHAHPSGQYRYYKVAAIHDREIPDLDPFGGYFTMARVSLPEANPAVLHTRIGSVEPKDHLLATVAEVRKKFGSLVGAPISRVDLVTPARLALTRFGAISVYLVYVQRARSPSFYILEAGTATGEPKVTFVPPNLTKPIVAHAGYVPTPFASSKHVYTGKLTLKGDSPDVLNMTAHKDSQSMPYIRLKVHFTETSTPQAIWPALLIIRAIFIIQLRRLQGVRRP